MSITSEQLDALSDGSLAGITGSLLNRGAEASRVAGLPVLEAKLAAAGQQFIDKAAANLESANRIDTGELQKSLTMKLTKVGDSSYILSVGYPAGSKEAQYFDYVNKGVKGVESDIYAPNSPYQFKYISPGGALLTAILQWISSHSIASRNEDQKEHSGTKYKLSALQHKRNVIGAISEQEKKVSIAWAIGTSIKKNGLMASLYFDNAVDEVFNAKFSESISKAIGVDIAIIIKSNLESN